MSFNYPKKNQSPARIEMANPEQLNEAQKIVYEKIVMGKRGKIVGPLRVALHSPELADKWQAFGEFVRYQTDLLPVVTELAIITTSRFWNSQVEWLIHSGIASEVGLSEDVIEAIRTFQQPVFEDELLAAVYEFTREMLEFGQVSDKVYQTLLELIGTAPIVELSAVVGYYTMVAMTLNVHHIPIPEDEFRAPLELDGTLLEQRPVGLPKAILRKKAS